MCDSRYQRVLRRLDAGTVLVEDLAGVQRRVSLLAYEGEPPDQGDWLVVHSGYALAPAPASEVAAARAALAGLLPTPAASAAPAEPAGAEPGGTEPAGAEPLSEPRKPSKERTP